MDEGKFVADFIAANIEKIVSIGKKAYGKFDASIQTNLRVAYTDYLNASRLKHSKSKLFFIRNQPVELYSYYVASGVACGEKLIEKPSFIECTGFSNRVVISGSGGSGKSVLMKHLFLDCIQDKRYTPILVELRDLNNYENSLDEYLDENLINFGFKANEAYVKKANEAGHFCYFFDGFDELTPKLRNKTIKYISGIAKKYSNCPIFISSRPDDVLTGLDDFSKFKCSHWICIKQLS
jgi:predicted NACHT family NTPase